jgi:hypothetical protein
MAEAESKASFLILVRTREGINFRPAHWAERLAGIMAPFHESYLAPAHGAAVDESVPASASRQPPSSSSGAPQVAGLLYSPFVRLWCLSL